MKTVAILLAALLICQTIPNLPVVGSSDAIAQERPMTPTLLKRLAEAVDGNRTGEPVWVIADYEYPNHVHGVRPARTTALADSVDELARVSGRQVGVFGPFTAPRDTLARIRTVSPLTARIDTVSDVRPMAGCIHNQHSSVMGYVTICPPEMFIPNDSIRSLSLLYETVANDTVRVPVPLTADAILFSVPALDKFVLPYYARILGIEEAARMRIRILEQFVGR